MDASVNPSLTQCGEASMLPTMSELAMIDNDAIRNKVANLPVAAISKRGGVDLDRDGALLIRAAFLVERAAREQLAEHVRTARARGLSWVQIGHALEISRQAAEQRFGSDDNRKPNLMLGGQMFTYGWVPRHQKCRGCAQPFVGDEGYSGPDRDIVRQPGHESANVLAFCVACARRRAQGSVGVVALEGKTYRCRVISWNAHEFDIVEVVLLDQHHATRESATPWTRRLPVDDFTPLEPWVR